MVDGKHSFQTDMGFRLGSASSQLYKPQPLAYPSANGISRGGPPCLPLTDIERGML